MVVYVMRAVFDVVRVMPIFWVLLLLSYAALSLVTASAIAMTMVCVTSVMNALRKSPASCLRRGWMG